MIDKYGRNIDYLRISLTENCNLRCIYCMPTWNSKENSVKTHDNLTKKEVVDVVKLFSKLGINKIRLTGGEPLLRNDLEEIIEEISNINGIKEICITTNGLMLSEKLEELHKKGLNRINISLDTMDKVEYENITRGGDIEKVLFGIKKAMELNIPIKINSVITNLQSEESIIDLVKLTMENNIDVRFIELMPIGEGKKLKGVTEAEIIGVLENNYTLNNLYTFEGTSKYYKINGGIGRIGFINPISECFCQSCNRVRITSNFHMKTCLSSNEKINLREIINLDVDETEKLEIVKNIIYNRNKESIFNSMENEKKNMNTIGG